MLFVGMISIKIRKIVFDLLLFLIILNCFKAWIWHFGLGKHTELKAVSLIWNSPNEVSIDWKKGRIWWSQHNQVWPSSHMCTPSPVGNTHVMFGKSGVIEEVGPRGARLEEERARLWWLLDDIFRYYSPPASQAIWHFVKIIFNCMCYNNMLNNSLF